MPKQKTEIYSEPLVMYAKMLRDIEHAKKYIYLETYIYDGDSVGIKFRNALASAAKRGVEVKVLVDAWGSSVNESFFASLRKEGGEVHLFRKFSFKPKIFKHNHKRDHRKLLLIDGNISYIGSANITADCLNWRELTLRFTGDIAIPLKKIFMNNFKLHIFFKHHKGRRQFYRHEGIDVISDTPSFFSQNIRRLHLNYLKNAKKEILIETPYFVPDRQIRKALRKAAMRGIDVSLVLPMRSDVRLVDILRNVYLGKLHKYGVKMFFYRPKVLHSKGMVVDGSSFIVGSANIDYRSFLHQYEICVSGINHPLSNLIHKHIMKTISDSESFSYEKWKNRPLLQKFFEWILSLFKEFI